MTDVDTYEHDYIDECKSRVGLQLVVYKRLEEAAAGKHQPQTANVSTALASFEPEFFNNMVLVLNGYFIHRSRTIEGNDGNPLNEVRALCSSILENKGIFRPEKTMEFQPERSVLKIRSGDRIALTEADFSRISAAFFAELERKFAE